MRVGVDETSTVRASYRQIGIESAQMSDTRFHSVREAKEFIAAQIAGQALRESVPFSEIERKMLLFSQVDGAPPEIMEVADQFDRQYNPTEYEKKVSTIIKHLDKRLRRDSPAEYDGWRRIGNSVCANHLSLLPVQVQSDSVFPEQNSYKII
jgi:hypothetical protein